MTSESGKIVAKQYLAELRTPSTILSAEAITHYSRQAVALFFDHVKTDGKPLREAIEILCEINSLPDPKLSRIGLEALFPQLIEKLNDSFDPFSCKLYDRLFAQVISFCRQLPEGRELDIALTQFGLRDEASIFARKTALIDGPKSLFRNRPLKKILFLSRVTIGADVAITSTLMARLKQRYPQAEIVLLGPQKLIQLYGGDPRIRIKPVTYGRTDNLFSRLNSWLNIAAIVDDEIVGLFPEEFCVFDPDSRLTQLGLLPLLSTQSESHCYYFFNSRSYSYPGLEKIGQLSSQWLNEVCEDAADAFPFISLSPTLSAIGEEIISSIKSQRNCRVICLSFGVGGNPTKKISEQYEMKLVQQLSGHYRLIVDRGFTNEENEQAARILASLESHGKSVLSLDEQSYLSNPFLNQSPIDVLAWQGGIGSFASLIASSDQYIGYDSSGQHLAAALAIPTTTIFVNSGSPAFAKRWQPYGSGKIHIIQVEPSQNSFDERSLNQLLQRVSLHQQLSVNQ